MTTPCLLFLPSLLLLVLILHLHPILAVAQDDWTRIGQPLQGNSARISSLTGHRLALEQDEELQVWEESSDGEWTLVGDDIDAESLAFFRISGNGQRIVVGCRSQTRFIPFPHVRVHQWNGANIGVYAKGFDVESGSLDQMIVDINDDGTRVAVGYNEHSYGWSEPEGYYGKGTVQLFDWNADEDAWLPVGNPIQDDQSWYFGKEVDLSGDGSTVVVSASYNNTPADSPGFYVNETWRVYRFSEKDEDWVLLGDTNLFDQYSSRHYSGEKYGTRDFSTISHDGNLIATGTTCQDATVLYSGESPCFTNDTSRVNVFQYENDEWTVLGQELTSNQEDEFGHVDIMVVGEDILLAVGARTYEEERGRVDLLRYQDGQWEPVTDPLYGSEPGERLGDVVGLAAQNRLLVAGRNSATIWQYPGEVIPVDVSQYEDDDFGDKLASGAVSKQIKGGNLFLNALFWTALLWLGL